MSGPMPPGDSTPTEGAHGTPPPRPHSPPQRLSARTLLVHPARQLTSLALPLLLLVLFGGALETGRFVVVPLVIVGVLASSLVRWLTFTYQIDEHRLTIVQGVLGRRSRSIPMDRIRGVDVSASPLHRLLGIAVVRIDAAAGGSEFEAQEGELDAISRTEAERLRTLLLRRAPHAAPQQPGLETAGSEPPDAAGTQQAPNHPHAPAGTAETGGTATAVSEQRVLARLRPRWYLYGPVTGGYLFAPLAVLGSLIGLLFELSGPTGVLSERELKQLFERGVQLPYLFLGLLAVVAVITVLVLAVVMFALVNWDFTLHQRDGSLMGERGLFTRRSVSLERDRVRGWDLRESLLQRITGAASLRAVVTGLGDTEQRAQLLPVAPRAEARGAAGRAVGPFEAPLLRHPAAARTRRLIRAITGWLAAAAIVELVAAVTPAPGMRPLTIALLVLAVVGVPLGLDRYRSLGHAVDGDRLSVRSGSLLRQQVVIERRAVVGWTVRQTWLQRRVGLVTLVAGVGAGQGGYPAVDIGTEEAVRFASEVTPSWTAPIRSDR